MLKVINVASIRPQFDVKIHFRKRVATTGVMMCGRNRRIMNTRTLNVSL